MLPDSSFSQEVSMEDQDLELSFISPTFYVNEDSDSDFDALGDIGAELISTNTRTTATNSLGAGKETKQSRYSLRSIVEKLKQDAEQRDLDQKYESVSG